MSITKQQILEAEGEELERMLGEVLQPDFCKTCAMAPDYCEQADDCNIIPLNWDNAMKWRDWACDSHGETAFDNAKCFAMKIWHLRVPKSVEHRLHGWHIADSHFANSSKPIDFLRAAAICKIGAKT